MPSRDDIKTFWDLEIDHTAVGLEPAGAEDACFCTPAGAEVFARLGCDGVHFVLLSEDERVFCVDPAMGEPGTYVLPVAEDFRQFLSFVLFCGGASPIAQIWWLSRSRFDALLAEDRRTTWPERDAALTAVSAAFGLEAADPYEAVKELQAGFDPTCLRFSAEYYDTLGLEGPEQEEP